MLVAIDKVSESSSSSSLIFFLLDLGFDGDFVVVDVTNSDICGTVELSWMEASDTPVMVATFFTIFSSKSEDIL